MDSSLGGEKLRTVGLTLIEILVALVIIGASFAALASWQITNMRMTRGSKQSSISTQVANEAMERAVKAFLEARDPDRAGQAAFRCAGMTGLACSGTYGDISLDGKVYSASYEYQVDNTLGLVEVEVSVTSPQPLTLNQYVSCMDVVPAPSFKDPRPCPTPAGWTIP